MTIIFHLITCARNARLRQSVHGVPVFISHFFQIMNYARPTVCRSAERRMKLEEQRAAKDKQRAVSSTKSPCIE